MPLTRYELIETFGAACDVGSAALFIGAGISKGAGLPDWGALLEDPRVQTDVPAIDDLPLMAEYILVEKAYSRLRLEEHLREALVSYGASPTPVHLSMGRLPVDQIWTTNYDTLLEQSLEQLDEEAAVISADDDVRLIGTTRKTIIKMHGSISIDGSRWDTPPVITRSDYEGYEEGHRRTWALLRASYLSKSMLFLGFSFDDPNIGILQRLARRHGTAARDRHITVMRKPPDTQPDDRRRHILRVRDLEDSGVRVHEIDSHDEVLGLVQALERRTRRPLLFVSGSGEDEPFHECARELGRVLVDMTEWEVQSLGGDAGWQVCRELAAVRRAERRYDARRLVFYSRRKDGPPPPRMDERIGTAVFTDLEREPLVRRLLDDSRAVVVIGGGDRTAEEIRWALEFGAGVVPIATAGGAARAYWEDRREDPPDLGGKPTDRDVWDRLGGEPVVAARAARTLLQQAMYLKSTDSRAEAK